jgi:hypothetical protein
MDGPPFADPLNDQTNSSIVDPSSSLARLQAFLSRFQQADMHTLPNQHRQRQLL